MDLENGAGVYDASYSGSFRSKAHLKGGWLVQSVRWTFVAFCFVIFAFSVAILVISSVNYAEMRPQFDEAKSQWTYDYHPILSAAFKPEAALGVFYVGMASGSVFTIISCLGWCGAACLDRRFLIAYAVALSFVLFGFCVAVAVVTHVYSDDLQKMAEQLFKGFVEHFYGRGEVMLSLVTKAIDTIQATHHCCGVLSPASSTEIEKAFGTTPAHYTVLYWLESTQWGQIRANEIGYDEWKSLTWTPRSCCRKVEPHCSEGIFGDRIEWDDEKEQNWTVKIHVEGCGPRLLEFSHMDPTSRAKIIAVIIVLFIIILTTIVLACWMGQSVHIYELSSKYTELEQRHRRRRLRRFRRFRELRQLRRLQRKKTAGPIVSKKKAELVPSRKTSERTVSAPKKDALVKLEEGIPAKSKKVVANATSGPAAALTRKDRVVNSKEGILAKSTSTKVVADDKLRPIVPATTSS